MKLVQTINELQKVLSQVEVVTKQLEDFQAGLRDGIGPQDLKRGLALTNTLTTLVTALRELV
jgi:hypothetical protein